MATASCLCGNVAWRITAPLRNVHHCHCGQCRKQHGTPFASFGAVPEPAFAWLRGQQGIRAFESSPGFRRSFCPGCGSVAPEAPAGGEVFMPLGSFDDDPGAVLERHIFVGSMASWHEITDALPRYEGYPPGTPSPDVAPLERRPSDAECVRGSCLCGAVAYRIDGHPGFLRNCHCGRCRKARSAAHASNFFVPLDRFEWTSGEAQVDAYPVPGARYFRQDFCRVCGSSVPRLDAERKLAVVPTGSVDGDPGARANGHIFVASKAPWYEITDPLPQYAEGAPA